MACRSKQGKNGALEMPHCGFYLLALLLFVTAEMRGGSARVTVKEGQVPSALVELVYQIALDQVSVSHAVEEVPALNVYFVTNLQPERFGRGRATRWSFYYARETAPPDQNTVWVVREAVTVMRKAQPWELWSEASDFDLLFTAMVGVLDYANQLYIDQGEVQALRAAGVSQWMCETGRVCHWQLLGSKEAKMSFLKKQSSPP